MSAMSKEAKNAGPVNGTRLDVRHDVRVDRIGLVGELVKNWIEGPQGVKARVKAAMAPGETVEGDLFQARLDACEVAQIEPAKLLALLDRGAITRAELCSMLSVNVAAARLALDARTFGRLCRTAPGTDRLVVSRKGHVEVGLVQAVSLLSHFAGIDEVGRKTQRA